MPVVNWEEGYQTVRYILSDSSYLIETHLPKSILLLHTSAMPQLSTTLISLLVAAVSVTAQVPAYGQCGGSAFTGSTTCVSGFTCTYANEWYSQCIPGTAGAGTTTTKTTAAVVTTTSKSTTTTAAATKTTTTTPVAGGGATPTALTTTFPASAGSTSYPTAVVVSGSFDGKMMKYDRNPKVCAEQDETGEKDAIFILEAGATLSNVIIGPNQAEGVHCKGTCTLNNVWWLDVCEDGATFLQSSGTSYVNGGGASSASDKVFQHNGFGTLSIKNFYVDTFGKLYRSCGNCSGNGKARNVVMDNIYAKNGGVLAGINTNYGDTARISNSCVPNGKVCDLFKGTTSGEPSKISSGPDGTYCVATNIKTAC